MFHTEDHIKSDRCPFSLQIIANILKTMKYKCISIYDVYSDKLEVLLDNHKLFNLNLISFNTVTKDAIICFASPIALDKYYGSGMDALIIKDSFNIEIESKPDKPITSDDRIVLMEYKCSNAFWNKRIGQYLKEQYPEVKLDILIRQAVTNSKVVNDLLEVFDNVYITNSYKEYQNLPDRCHIIDICL